MSKAAESVYVIVDRYLAYMKSRNKEPTQITVSRKQMDTVLKAKRTALNKAKKKGKVEWTEYKGFPVVVEGAHLTSTDRKTFPKEGRSIVCEDDCNSLPEGMVNHYA